MATMKRVFTLRLNDEIFDKVEKLAEEEHRSMTNLIEYMIISYLKKVEEEQED